MAALPRLRCYPAILIATLLLLLSGGLEAQRLPAPSGQLAIAIGPRVGGDWDEKVWSVGGQARVSLPFLPGLQVAPSADVFLLDEANEWQVNLDVVMQLLPIIYGGAGFAVARDSLATSAGPTTETGYNLFLGLTFPSLRFPVRPFAEVRWTQINRLVRPRRIVVGFDLFLFGQPYRRR
jgi:hypothetical protein